MTSAKREGIRYVLTDSRFKTLGFIPETRVFMSNITIPKTDENLVAPEEWMTQLRSAKHVVGTWIFE